MGVGVEQPRHHRLGGEVDDGSTGRYREAGPDGFDEAVLHEDDLVFGGRAGRRIDQAARLDSDGLGVHAGGAETDQNGVKHADAWECQLHGSLLPSEWVLDLKDRKSRCVRLCAQRAFFAISVFTNYDNTKTR